MSRVEIFTDGACSGNPGPGGWGAILHFGEATRELSGGAKETTNNRMELTAAIEALNALTRPCDVVLTTDSVYVKDGITAWIDGWKRRGWKNSKKEPVKNEDLWKALDAAQLVGDLRRRRDEKADGSHAHVALSFFPRRICGDGEQHRRRRGRKA